MQLQVRTLGASRTEFERDLTSLLFTLRRTFRHPPYIGRRLQKEREKRMADPAVDGSADEQAPKGECMLCCVNRLASEISLGGRPGGACELPPHMVEIAFFLDRVDRWIGFAVRISPACVVMLFACFTHRTGSWAIDPAQSLGLVCVSVQFLYSTDTILLIRYLRFGTPRWW